MSRGASRGVFITLEGPEGSGKSTAARHLAEWLRTEGVPTTLTAEPGGTPVGEEIRRLLLHIRSVSDDLDPKADALLFAAGRAQHVARRIRPALQRGEWVVCARYLDSSMAYQGGGYGLDMDELRELQAFATGGLKPDLTLLLDVPVEIGLGRKRRDRWNRFEDTESAVFFERVRRTYLDLAAAEPNRYRVLDASGSVDDTDAAIRELVTPLLHR
jgi:dTMP kinase